MKVINEILNKKKAQPVNIPYLVYNDKRYTGKTDIANVFNTFFTNVGPSLAKKFKDNNNTSYKDWMKINCPDNELHFEPISHFRVLDELYSLDCSKAVGHDGLPGYFVKMIAELICQPLTFILNSSTKTCIFPDEMKIAKVVPIFKNGDREHVSNYRPISLLPIFSKIFEKIICRNLTEHLESNICFMTINSGSERKEVQRWRFLISPQE